jgi:hypothetical protein
MVSELELVFDDDPRVRAQILAEDVSSVWADANLSPMNF